MAKSPVAPPRQSPRLIPSIVGADQAVLARESTDHAAAIQRTADQALTAQTAAAAAQTSADAAGAAAAAAAALPRTGRLLAAPTILTGSGSGVLPAGTCVVCLRGVGGGGGGGGAQGGGAGTAASGGGGASGVYLEIWVGTPGVVLASLAISWAAGAAGTGGSNAGGNGNNGTASTFVINGVTYTFGGGAGGTGMTSGAGSAFAGEGAPSLAGSSTGSATVVHQGPGEPGLRVSTGAGPVTWSGTGGSCPGGAGGHSALAFATGNPGLGQGGGGAGASAAAAGFAGGDGAAGGFNITPYS